jgi:hypothetical protein
LRTNRSFACQKIAFDYCRVNYKARGSSVKALKGNKTFSQLKRRKNKQFPASLKNPISHIQLCEFPKSRPPSSKKNFKQKILKNEKNDGLKSPERHREKT